MKLKEQNILFFTRTMELGGTENVILQLCEIFQPLVNKIIVCSSGGMNESKLKKMGITHYKMPDIEKKAISTVAITVKNIKRIVKNERITVIHSHHRMAAFYVTMLGMYKDYVFINTSHNTFTDKRLLTKYAFKYGHLIACGEMVKANLVNLYDLPEKQIRVIHNSVKAFEEDIEKDILISKLHNEGNIVVGNIGRLSKQKGMEFFIRAIPDVIEKYPKIKFIIVGSGEDEIKLKNLGKQLKLENYLFFLGYRNDVQNLISQVDFIVLSSLWEGLPLTPIEAFSVGKTIIATAVDGTVEIVQDGINGLLIPPSDSRAISNQILYLISNNTSKSKFESEAKRRYKDEYSFDKFAQTYIEYYEEL